MRFLFRLGMTLFALLLAAVVAFFFIPAEKIGGFASEQFESATGRAMTLSGTIKPSFYPVIGVTTGPIEIANADWSTAGPMLRAESMVIGVNVKALMGGRVVVKTLRIVSPEILLEKSASGQANWEFGSPGSTDETAGALPDFSLPDARITAGKFTYVDHATDQSYTFEDIDLLASVPAPDGPAEFTISGAVNGLRSKLRVKIDSIAKIIAGNIVPVSLTLKSKAADGKFSGRIGLSPLAGAGDLSLDIDSLPLLLSAAGLEPVALPKPYNKAGFEGNLTLASDGSYHLRAGKISFGPQSVSAEADVVIEEKPIITAKVIAGQLDLTPFMGESENDTGSDGWPKTPIDVSSLGLVDASAVLRADGVDLGFTKLGPTRLSAELANSRLVTNIQEASVYGGQISGKIVANGRGGFSTSADISGSSVQLQPFLSGMMGYDRLKGAADFKIAVLGIGNSIDALMRNLKGTGSISIGQGEILGFDLVGMIKTLDTSYRGANDKTVFRSVDGSFAIDKGVLSNNDLKFLSPIIDAAGGGTVNLGNRSLDYTVRATRFNQA